MKKSATIISLIISVVFNCCSSNENNRTIQFIPLSEKDFNYSADTTFAVPKGKIWDERKRMHDSCMGTSFPANSIFIRTRDTFYLGCIVNRQTMKIVKNLDLRRLTGIDFGNMFRFITKPCYERRSIHISIDSFFRKTFMLKISSAREDINKEFNEAIRTSVYNEIETGSWFNAELTDALGKILDTSKNESLLEYKKYLLEPDNMVLMRSSSLTDVTLYIHTRKPMSAALQNILIKKPFAMLENISLKPQLFFVDGETIQITMNGIFQMMGQFMKGELH
jgi:hypothetical protein